MTLLYSGTCFLQHDTGVHPERAERIRLVQERFRQTGLDRRCRQVQWQPVNPQRLARVHSPTYADGVRALASSGGGFADPDTVVSSASYDVALLAAGAVCDAAERVIRGEESQALCLVRPPGHHAVRDYAMGFCLFNNVAIAAKTATDELGLDRVLIVDWDVHHGNGTEAVFWEDPKVGFLSIHRWPFYPGTGTEDSTGSGDGLGTTLNLPVPFGTSRKDYLGRFAEGLDKLAAVIKPQLILLSAGFDAHHQDPVGSLGLETEDFVTLTNLVLDAADTYAGGKLISVLEGGYHPQVMADCLGGHLSEMLKRSGGGHCGEDAQ